MSKDFKPEKYIKFEEAFNPFHIPKDEDVPSWTREVAASQIQAGLNTLHLIIRQGCARFVLAPASNKLCHMPDADVWNGLYPDPSENVQQV